MTIMLFYATKMQQFVTILQQLVEGHMFQKGSYFSCVTVQSEVDFTSTWTWTIKNSESTVPTPHVMLRYSKFWKFLNKMFVIQMNGCVHAVTVRTWIWERSGSYKVEWIRTSFQINPKM